MEWLLLHPHCLKPVKSIRKLSVLSGSSLFISTYKPGSHYMQQILEMFRNEDFWNDWLLVTVVWWFSCRYRDCRASGLSPQYKQIKNDNENYFMLRSLHPYFMTFVYRITLVISWLTCAICASNYCPLKVIIMLRVKQQFCPGLSWTWSGKG